MMVGEDDGTSQFKQGALILSVDEGSSVGPGWSVVVKIATSVVKRPYGQSVTVGGQEVTE